MRAEYLNFGKTKNFDSLNFEIEHNNLDKLNVKTVILSLKNNLNEIIAALEPLDF
jgi:hypothetical protein